MVLGFPPPRRFLINRGNPGEIWEPKCGDGNPKSGDSRDVPLSFAGEYGGDGRRDELSWNYDRFGNRLNQNVTAGSAPAPSVSVDPATNRINSAGYAYDAAGNMVWDQVHDYAYDAENRLTVVDPQLNPVAASYTYLGALRVKRDFGGTTIYVYSGTVPIAEYAAGAQLTQPNKEYIYSGSQLLATVDASLGTSYQMPDHLSTRVEADANATVTRTFGHFPFGEVWYETGTASKWKFTTYERGDSGEGALDYADFRFDSSRLGRFMSPDVLAGYVGAPESLNRYAYVTNDPINMVDPRGQDGTCPDDSTYDCSEDSEGNPDIGAVEDQGPFDLGLLALDCSDPMVLCTSITVSDTVQDSPLQLIALRASSQGCDWWDVLCWMNSLHKLLTAGDACKGVKASDLKYNVPLPRGGGRTETGEEHIMNRHILPGSGASMYVTFPPISPEAMLAQVQVYNAITFTVPTTRTVQPNGNFWFRTVFPVLPNPYADNSPSVIGVSNTGLPENTNNLVLKPDCVTVVTSYPSR